MTTYLSSTRHPWVCFLFLLPLLAAYEGGLFWLGGDQARALRNGADAWLRWAFEVFGAGHVLAAAGGGAGVTARVELVALGRPPATTRSRRCSGWRSRACCSRSCCGSSAGTSGRSSTGSGSNSKSRVRTAPAAQILTFIGAGIYEEVLFRLGLFGGLVLTPRVLRIPNSGRSDRRGECGGARVRGGAPHRPVRRADAAPTTSCSAPLPGCTSRHCSWCAGSASRSVHMPGTTCSSVSWSRSLRRIARNIEWYETPGMALVGGPTNLRISSSRIAVTPPIRCEVVRRESLRDNELARPNLLTSDVRAERHVHHDLVLPSSSA